KRQVLQEVEVPDEPIEPTVPAVPLVQWHRNLVVQQFTVTKPQKPLQKSSSKQAVTPVKLTDPAPAAVTSEKTLPQTGDTKDYGIAVFGAGILAFTVATLLGSTKRREED
ncbi:LPXTG cell wall anchor domain-containing protein, partial [Streptococcus sobrinus]|uniref:LPXTG cell wall anchor domain-containing protein n=1 Tax=Streptococcus sobrinus TaxID=1310 RepID=UPI000516BA3D